MTPFETILIGAIGTGLVGIATLITWMVKYLLPKAVEAWEKREMQFSENFSKITTAVEEIPKIMNQLTFGVSESVQLGKDNKFEIQKLREDIFDKRIQDLQDQINHTAGPLSQRPSLKNVV